MCRNIKLNTISVSSGQIKSFPFHLIIFVSFFEAKLNSLRLISLWGNVTLARKRNDSDFNTISVSNLNHFWPMFVTCSCHSMFHVTFRLIFKSFSCSTFRFRFTLRSTGRHLWSCVGAIRAPLAGTLLAVITEQEIRVFGKYYLDGANFSAFITEGPVETFDHYLANSQAEQASQGSRLPLRMSATCSATI